MNQHSMVYKVSEKGLFVWNGQLYRQKTLKAKVVRGVASRKKEKSPTCQATKIRKRALPRCNRESNRNQLPKVVVVSPNDLVLSLR